MSHIDLRSNGRRVLIPIRILRSEPSDLTSVEAVALLDTGATTSGISRDIALKLDLPEMGKRPMGSARGLDQVQRYLFRIGLEPSDTDLTPAFPFVFPPALGFEIVRGSSFEALLGMDILRFCDLSLRRDGSGRLTFG